METKDLYKAADSRYDNQQMYTFCGHSGVILPKLSLGFWHNFGSVDPYERSRAITHYAFDHGITHFDLANNYGPVYGSAEETMGRLMDDSFRPYRDELFISTKAGYDMWPGPYGNGGSRKYLMSSLDQSLTRRQSVVCRYLQLAAGTTAQGLRLSGAARRTATHLSGQTQPPVDRTYRQRTARFLPRERYRLYRLLAAGTGSADRPLYQRYTCRLTHGKG